MRLHRARALALRLAGSPESGRSAAEVALSIAAEGGCIGLEHGLALAEAARCSLAAGDPAEAARQLRAALAVWEAGQVDGPELLAAGARRARAAASGALTPLAAPAASRIEPKPPMKFRRRVACSRRESRFSGQKGCEGLSARTCATRPIRRVAMEHDHRETPIACSARPVRQHHSSPHAAVADDSAVPPAVDADGCTTGPARTPVDTPICRGKANFHDRTLAGLGGNGRACSDCHMDSENFQLTPAAAQQRFAQMTMTGVDDPLFRAIDADDFRVNGAAAHDFTNLTQNGLVRVTLPLPANVKLLDCGAKVPCPASARPTSETVADVWRAVPSILDANITGPDGAGPASTRGPNPSGGYQLDGRIDTLQNQALSALRNHAGTRNDPPASFLDDLASFQNAQFSVPEREGAVGRHRGTHEPAAGSRSGPGRAGGGGQGCLQPRPAPSATATWVAIRAAARRSSRARQARRPPSSATTASHSACPRPVDTVNPPRFVFAACSASQMENVRTYEITNSGAPPSGTPCGGAPPQPACVTRVTISDPGRMLLTGYPVPGGPGDIQHFDNPSLRGIARTAPYFHNNTAATLEDVLEHYKQFFKCVAIQQPAAPLLTTQPGVVPPVHDRPFTDAEIPALLAYLRKL